MIEGHGIVADPQRPVRARVLEVVLIELSEPGEAAFETALAEAATLFAAAPGYCGHQAGRCLDVAGHALLMVWWNSLEDHTVRFRGSPAYADWRRLIDPHIRPGPLVRHFQLDPHCASTNAHASREVPLPQA